MWPVVSILILLVAVIYFFANTPKPLDGTVTSQPQKDTAATMTEEVVGNKYVESNIQDTSAPSPVQPEQSVKSEPSVITIRIVIGSQNFDIAVRDVSDDSLIDAAGSFCMEHAESFGVAKENINANCIKPIYAHLKQETSVPPAPEVIPAPVMEKPLELLLTVEGQSPEDSFPFLLSVNSKQFMLSFSPRHITATNAAIEFCTYFKSQLLLSNEEEINSVCAPAIANYLSTLVVPQQN